MKKLTFLTLTVLILFCVQDCFATQWAKTYCGAGGLDYANSMQQTSDGGYILAGRTDSFGAGLNDSWVLKLDSSGSVEWQKTYGVNGSEYAASVQQTSDGGYILAGHTYSFGAGEDDFWVLKLDSSGSVEWQKTYGGTDSEGAYSVKQTSDGGYVVAGETYSFGAGDYDFWVLKLDSSGSVQWQKTYGGTSEEYALSVQQTSDGGYIVEGNTTSFGAGANDSWVLKLDSSGSVEWQKTYGGTGNEGASSVQQTSDGGYIVAGRTYSFGAGGWDSWILKLDSSGSVQWQKTYGGFGFENASSVQQTSDGGYIVAGYTYSFGAGTDDFWVLKLDSSGSVQWQKTYGGTSNDDASSVQQTSDGGYIVAGRTLSFGAGGIWVLKLDSSGDINNAAFIDTTAATITDTNISGVTSAAIITTPSPTITDSSAVVQDSTAEIELQGFAPNWFAIDPPPQDKLNGVWGYLSGGSHIFYAVGEDGLIIRYDGTSLVGSANYTLEDLYGIWGSSGSVIFAVGDNSAIIHYDGTSWTDMSPTSFTINLKDVWGSSSTDVYAVGDGGKIAHYNGSWSEVTSPTTDNLNSIWGSSASHYVAVGENGTIIEYNGSWSTVSSPTPNDLSEVWGSASDNIYAVGKLGTIIHYDGTSWSDLTATESPTSANLKGIWGSSANNIFAVGEHGTILYYDGISWQKMDSGVQDRLISTFGTLNPQVMVVGYDGNILHLSGPWVQGRICSSCSGLPINEVSVTFDPGELQQTKETDEVGVYPAISSWGDGAKEILFSATDYIEKAITVDLPNNGSIVDHATYLLPDPGYETCISGTITKTVKIGPLNMERDNKRGVQNMVVKLYLNGAEVGSTVTDVGGNYYFTGLSSEDPYKVEPVITASECTATPTEYAGITVPIATATQYDFDLDCPETPSIPKAYWSPMTYPTGIDKVLLHGIWGGSGSDIFAVGDGGTIVHYNGTDWSDMASSTTKKLKGVWGSSGSDVYAVGEEGVIIHYNGTSWQTPMDSDTENDLNAIWGYSASDIFGVGNSGTVTHYDGTDWGSMESGTGVKLLSVWGNSGSDVYAMGNSHKDEEPDSYWERTVIHYDGTSWTEVETGNGVTLMSSWGSAGDDVTATGSFGSIMRYDGTDWKQIGGPTERTLNAMWGSSSNSIFAVGFDGVIAHYDGTDWDVRGKDKSNLFGIWGQSATEVYAVGDEGTILRYDGDLDGDGEPDSTDNCPEVYNDTQTNSDSDSYGDACDNCPNDDNEDQANSDHDTLGNVCDPCPFDTDNDIDNDGICGDVDNCRNMANGAVLGTCISYTDGSARSTCTADEECTNGYCSKNQEDIDGDNIGDVCDADIAEDTMPPGGNDCIDAYECEGDFEPDGDVDGTDAVKFKTDFFRKDCAEPTPCNGDFECDGDVDGTDAVKFKADFFRKDCPSCTFSCF